MIANKHNQEKKSVVQGHHLRKPFPLDAGYNQADVILRIAGDLKHVFRRFALSEKQVTLFRLNRVNLILTRNVLTLNQLH